MSLILPFLQVIVFYHHPSAHGVPVMWPGNKIPAPWANTTEPYKLTQVSKQLLYKKRPHSVEQICWICIEVMFINVNKQKKNFHQKT